ncbi:uncharacterized protein LOC134714444 [Mytilus trossulus]|uniref:uncharacterized protein LOC134714444 n=1 Tax=Mytilus trossulus TaxID=6551 RepID=UPI0030052E27
MYTDNPAAATCKTKLPRKKEKQDISKRLSMGKSQKQRQKAKRDAKNKNENQTHVTPTQKGTGSKKRKTEHTDISDSDRAQPKSPNRKNMDSSSLIAQPKSPNRKNMDSSSLIAQPKSPNRKNMDSSSLIEHQQDVNRGDDSNTSKNEVGLGQQKEANETDVDNSKQGGRKQKETNATDVDNSKQGGRKQKETNATDVDNSKHGGNTDKDIKNENISSSITHSTDQNKNDPNTFMDDKNTQEEKNNGQSEIKNIHEDCICDKQGKDVLINLKSSAVNVSSNILITEHTFKESESTGNVPNDESNTLSTSRTETKNKFGPLDDHSNENTEDGKGNDDGDGFINETENGKSIDGHIPQLNADSDKEITEDDTSGIGVDNGVQNQQGKSQGDFIDEETGDNTFHSLNTDDTLDNNHNEEETTENENNSMSDTSTDPHTDEDDHDSNIGAKNNTETSLIFNTREDGRDKSYDEQQFIERDSFTNMAGDNIHQAPEYQEKNYHNQENFAEINHKKANSTSTNTINCEEQCESISSTPAIDSSYQGQHDQMSQLNDITVQAESSTTLQGMDQLSTTSQSEIEGASSYDLMDDKNTPEEEINDTSEIENIAGEFTGGTQRKFIHAKLNHSAADTSSTTGSSEFGSSDNVNMDMDNTLDTTNERFRNHEQLQVESTNILAEENIGNDDNGSSRNKHTFEKSNGQNSIVQIQQSVEDTKEAFQKLETLQQQLESVTKENGNLLECNIRLENELKCGKQELDVWTERANEFESEKDSITESWKESAEKTQQKLTSFELELTSALQEKEQVVEHKNQLEEQLQQVNDALEGWKQNNAPLESQKESKTQLEGDLKTVNGQLEESREDSNELQNKNEEIQQSFEETKQSLHQELALLQKQLDSLNQENSNIRDEKEQLVQSQQQLTDELDEFKSKLAKLENRKEQVNISTKVIEETIKQQYSEIQSHLESSETHDYKRLSDEKDQLEEQLMQVNSELDEMKEKLVALENVTEEKDQLEQELDRMRDIAAQLESIKEENERYREQYQQINDQLRTTEQQLEQSCQECEGLSADLVRKSEKEDHYRYIETMVVTLGREKENHLKEIQELRNKVDLVEEVLISLKEERKMKDETIKQLRADVQIKDENSLQIKRQYEAGIEQLQTIGQLRDSEIENQKREIARMKDISAQLESMKEENERYREQYQQINDQLRTTEQQLEQSCQECEGLSADLVRKTEKEDHYRYIETMVVTLGREKENHLKEIQELRNKVDLVEEVLISLKEERKMKDETIKQLRADVQIKEENSLQIKRQYTAGIEQLQTMGQLRDSEIENQKREIARISSLKQQLEGNIIKTSLELQTRQSDLQREQLEHNQTRNTLTQCMEKMNSQVQSKDKEIEIMQEEVNKVRIESRELQLKYRDLPQKEAHFKVIENSNQYLMDENAQLQERIRSFGPFESTLHYIREENSRLSWEVQRYQVITVHTIQISAKIIHVLLELKETKGDLFGKKGGAVLEKTIVMSQSTYDF